MSENQDPPADSEAPKIFDTPEVPADPETPIDSEIPEELKRKDFERLSDGAFSLLSDFKKAVEDRKENGQEVECFQEYMGEITEITGNLKQDSAEANDRVLFYTGHVRKKWEVADSLRVLKDKFPETTWDVLDRLSPNTPLGEVVEELSGIYKTITFSDDAAKKIQMHLDLLDSKNCSPEVLGEIWKTDPGIEEIDRVSFKGGEEREPYLKSTLGICGKGGTMSILQSRRQTIESNRKRLDSWAFMRLFRIDLEGVDHPWDLLGVWFYYPLLWIARLYLWKCGLSAGKVSTPEAKETRRLLRESDKSPTTGDKGLRTQWTAWDDK